MRARVRIVIAAAVAVFVLAACGPSVSPAPSGGVRGDMVVQHNKVRAFFKLPGFARDYTADGHAQFHANRLLKSSRGVCSGSTLKHSTELALWYAGHYAAENVACIGGSSCPTNATQLMDMWMRSAGHRTNILNRVYRYIGVGAACDGRTIFAVAQFRS
jgi:uncharacterized protein YkwD